MPKFMFDKLVRNNIVGLQESDGYSVDHCALSGAELVSALLVKVHEEVDEVATAVALGERSEVVKELADVQELLAELMVQLNVSTVEVSDARVRKNEQAGSFSQGTHIVSVDIPDGDAWIAYYREQPEKYPEL